jgi:hypothetical protein
MDITIIDFHIFEFKIFTKLRIKKKLNIFPLKYIKNFNILILN